MGFLDKIPKDKLAKEGMRILQTKRPELEKLGDKALDKIKTKVVSENLEMKHIDNFKDFKAGYEKDGKDPRKALFYYIIGVLEYATGDKQEGEPMITLTLPKDDNIVDSSSPSGFKLHIAGEGKFVQMMEQNPNIIKSYVGGTNKNNYEIDKEHLKIHIVGKHLEDKWAVIDIQSGGKDIYSRVQLKKNMEGIWKLSNTSSLATGVKKTEQKVDDF